MNPPVTVCLGLLAIGACACTPSAPAPVRAARPVRVEQVRSTPPEDRLRYSANVEPHEQIVLAFKSSGYVRELGQRRVVAGRSQPLQAGDVVRQGQMLARVYPGDSAERLKLARARVDEAAAALAKARQDLERARTLFDAESLTRPELDAATAQHDTAAARHRAAEAEAALTESALRDTALLSPIDGVVLARHIEIGSFVAAGTPALVVVNLASMRAVFGVPDSVVQRLRPNDTLDVSIEALGERVFPARIDVIAPSADPQSRTFGVEVELPNRDGLLRAGMIATVDVGVGSTGGLRTAPGTPAVPLSAVVRPDPAREQYAVFVVDSADGETGIARTRRVTLGHVIGDAIAVTDGLSSSDRVVVNGATLVTDGERVRIVP